jgi:hypothetical protein
VSRASSAFGRAMLDSKVPVNLAFDYLERFEASETSNH